MIINSIEIYNNNISPIYFKFHSVFKLSGYNHANNNNNNRKLTTQNTFNNNKQIDEDVIAYIIMFLLLFHEL